MKQTNLFKSVVIYIPFMNFYEDKTCFAYSGVHEGTITSRIASAAYMLSIDDAKKLFNRYLKVLCPKELWKNFGLLKTTLDKLISYKARYQVDNTLGFSDKYIPVRRLMNDFEVINI